MYKTCTCCGIKKPIKEFPIAEKSNPGIGKWRGDCKKCHSKHTYNLYKEREMTKAPHRYYECDECDSINSKKFKNCKTCGTPYWGDK